MPCPPKSSREGRGEMEDAVSSYGFQTDTGYQTDTDDEAEEMVAAVAFEPEGGAGTDTDSEAEQMFFHMRDATSRPTAKSAAASPTTQPVPDSQPVSPAAWLTQAARDDYEHHALDSEAEAECLSQLQGNWFDHTGLVATVTFNEAHVSGEDVPVTLKLHAPRARQGEDASCLITCRIHEEQWEGDFVNNRRICWSNGEVWRTASRAAEWLAVGVTSDQQREGRNVVEGQATETQVSQSDRCALPTPSHADLTASEGPRPSEERSPEWTGKLERANIGDDGAGACEGSALLDDNGEKRFQHLKGRLLRHPHRAIQEEVASKTWHLLYTAIFARKNALLRVSGTDGHGSTERARAEFGKVLDEAENLLIELECELVAAASKAAVDSHHPADKSAREVRLRYHSSSTICRALGDIERYRGQYGVKRHKSALHRSENLCRLSLRRFVQNGHTFHSIGVIRDQRHDIIGAALCRIRALLSFFPFGTEKDLAKSLRKSPPGEAHGTREEQQRQCTAAVGRVFAKVFESSGCEHMHDLVDAAEKSLRSLVVAVSESQRTCYWLCKLMAFIVCTFVYGAVGSYRVPSRHSVAQELAVVIPDIDPDTVQASAEWACLLRLARCLAEEASGADSWLWAPLSVVAQLCSQLAPRVWTSKGAEPLRSLLQQRVRQADAETGVRPPPMKVVLPEDWFLHGLVVLPDGSTWTDAKEHGNRSGVRESAGYARRNEDGSKVEHTAEKGATPPSDARARLEEDLASVRSTSSLTDSQMAAVRRARIRRCFEGSHACTNSRSDVSASSHSRPKQKPAPPPAGPSSAPLRASQWLSGGPTTSAAGDDGNGMGTGSSVAAAICARRNSASGASAGASASASQASGAPAPLIVVDAANVAIRHGGTLQDTRSFSSRGVELVLDYYKRRGNRVIAFIPEYFLRERPGVRRKGSTQVMPDDVELLKKLVSRNILVLTPPQDYDDLYTISYAQRHDGCVVTNDMFRDYIERCTQRVQAETWTRTHLISYAFAGDEFLPNPAFQFPPAWVHGELR